MRSGHLRTVSRRLTRPRPLSGLISLGRSPLGAVMLIALAVVIGVTVVGLVRLWPSGSVKHSSALVSTKTVAAEVSSVNQVECSVQVAGQAGCQVVTVKILEGADEGVTSRLLVSGVSAGPATLKPGDRVRVFKTPPPPPGTEVTERLPPYSFADFDRQAPMLWLGIAFVVLLLVTGRFTGLRAFVGLAASLLVLLKFVVPSILEGNSPVQVALIGSFAVLLVTIPVCYGIGPKAIAAWLGTAASLLIAVELASTFVDRTHLSGASSEEAIFLSSYTSGVSLHGLLLAGMIVAALGVLCDLTVSQASTVIALRRASPSLGVGGLFRGALDVGHDHIAATVNTLVFAYAGASLPVLLIFSMGGTTFTDAINSEAVAEEVVATLIGSIGLILSMPITTGLAALLAVRMPERQLAAAAHAGHAH
jgi:uncharacterized membrane protein